MSTSIGRSTKRSLARSYAKLAGSRSSEEIGSRPDGAYLHQVQEKVEALNINEEVVTTPTPVTQAGTQDDGTSINTETTSIATTSDVTISTTTDHVAIPIPTSNNEADISPSGATATSQGTTVTDTHHKQEASRGEQVDTSTQAASNSDTTASYDKYKMSKKKMAQDLTDPVFMRDCFSNVVEHPATFAVDENMEEIEQDLRTPTEKAMAQARGEHRFAHVCNFPLKLILTPLSRGAGIITATFSQLLEMEFGPLHAAIQIGDVILEWNDSSLVVPHFCEHDDPLLKANIQHLTGWVDYTDQHLETMREAAKKLDYQGQIELIFRATAEKSRLIDALVKVIVNYNRYHWYNLIDRNCQHFVLDALKALGVDKPIQFTGGLGKYYESLKSGKSKSVPVKYKNHAELDLYIKSRKTNDKLDSMPQADLEFLLAQYFQFHLQDRSQYQKDPVALENWKCTERECLMPELEKRIELKNLSIQKFKTVH